MMRHTRQSAPEEAEWRDGVCRKRRRREREEEEAGTEDLGLT